MSYSPQALVPSTNNGTNDEQNMKLYKALIFSIPICFTFIVLFVFYIIYLRRRNNNINWSSIEMHGGSFNSLYMIELGLREELREMLPIVIFGESFIVKDSECSICLGDYEKGEKLQQIPACGHIFHMKCINTWLSSHISCPLCRVCLISKVPQDDVPSMENTNAGASAEQESQSISEIETHIEDGQEGNGDIREDDRNNI